MYPPFLKITTWDFSKLTTRCNLFALNCCWRPAMVLDRRTTSSAKSIIKICRISGDSVIPRLPFRTISLASSLIRRENKIGLQLFPCLRPLTTHECFSEITTYSNSGLNNFIHTFDCLIHFASDTIFLEN